MAARRIFRIDVVHVPHIHLPFGFAVLDVNCFVDLAAVPGQFERSAHLSALRILFIRHQPASIPARGDFLIIPVRGFLQLPPIRKERQLAEVLVGDVHLRILQRNT